MDNTDVTLLPLYLESLSEKETKAYKIAKDHLGSSFSLVKSNGYIKWKKANIHCAELINIVADNTNMDDDMDAHIIKLYREMDNLKIASVDGLKDV